MKRIFTLISISAIAITLFSGCGNTGSTTTKQSEIPTENTTQKAEVSNSNFDNKREIGVVSREDGSGTRGAFIELFGVEVKGADGTKKDMTTRDAVIVNKTDIMMNNVANDTYSIGYISLGSLNDTVKALKIDGVTPSAENVKNGTYKIARPFNIATKGEPTGVTKDFIDFILSSDGQAVVSKSYIAINDSTTPYTGDKPSGKITVAGSSSVTPVMEKLKEAYELVNPNATIEIQMSDSTAGMTGAIDGTCDIGMASRELKDSEKEKLQSLEIALDGLAVIVNKVNPLDDIQSDIVKQIYTGETTIWGDILQ